jgi:hypothetical protein
MENLPEDAQDNPDGWLNGTWEIVGQFNGCPYYRKLNYGGGTMRPAGASEVYLHWDFSSTSMDRWVISDTFYPLNYHLYYGSETPGDPTGLHLHSPVNTTWGTTNNVTARINSCLWADPPPTTLIGDCKYTVKFNLDWSCATCRYTVKFNLDWTCNLTTTTCPPKFPGTVLKDCDCDCDDMRPKIVGGVVQPFDPCDPCHPCPDPPAGEN